MDAKRVVVGTRGGSGSRYARAFAAAGYDVLVVDVCDPDRLPAGRVDVVLLDVATTPLSTIGRLAARCAIAVHGGSRTLRIEALDAGADVVLEDPEVGVAQVDALLRSRGKRRRVERLGEVIVDWERCELQIGGSTLPLTPTECALAGALVSASGHPVSKFDLLARVWDAEVYDPNIVEVHVSHLRRKLRRAGDPRIETVRGRGYLFRVGASGPAEVERLHQATDRRRAEDLAAASTSAATPLPASA